MYSLVHRKFRGEILRNAISSRVETTDIVWTPNCSQRELERTIRFCWETTILPMRHSTAQALSWEDSQAPVPRIRNSKLSLFLASGELYKDVIFTFMNIFSIWSFLQFFELKFFLHTYYISCPSCLITLIIWEFSENYKTIKGVTSKWILWTGYIGFIWKNLWTYKFIQVRKRPD